MSDYKYLLCQREDGKLDYDGCHSIDTNWDKTINIIENLPVAIITRPIKYWELIIKNDGAQIDIKDITEKVLSKRNPSRVYSS